MPRKSRKPQPLGLVAGIFPLVMTLGLLGCLIMGCNPLNLPAKWLTDFSIQTMQEEGERQRVMRPVLPEVPPGDR